MIHIVHRQNRPPIRIQLNTCFLRRIFLILFFSHPPTAHHNPYGWIFSRLTETVQEKHFALSRRSDSIEETQIWPSVWPWRCRAQKKQRVSLRCVCLLGANSTVTKHTSIFFPQTRQSALRGALTTPSWKLVWRNKLRRSESINVYSNTSCLKKFRNKKCYP